MEYNWEEIFKKKSNKELYDIYIGKSILPQTIRPVAKKELERRKFDFENMEANRIAWELSGLVEDEIFFNSQVYGNKFIHIPFKFYLLSIAVFMALFIFFSQNIKSSIYIDFLIFFIILTAIYFLNNFQYKKQQEKINNINNKKLELTDKLEKEGLLNKESPIFTDILREKGKSEERKRILMYFTLVMILILWIIDILVKFN